MRVFTAIAFCLLLASCMGMPLSGDSDTVLNSPSGAFSLKLPPDWRVAQNTTGKQGGVSVLAHKDAAATGRGYPTMVIKEVREPSAQGVLDIMARDKGLEFSELWGVTPDSYRLEKVLLDDSSRALFYWLVPRDGQDLEYYACIHLTRFGRVEMTGVALSGTVPKYMKDFNSLFTGLTINGDARFTGSTPSDTRASLQAIYSAAIRREKEGLARHASETASWAAAPGLSAQEKGFLAGAYVRAVDRATADAGQLLDAVFTGREPSELAHLGDRLDESGTALETIQLNIRGGKALDSVKKTAQKARRLARLAREAAKLEL